MPSAAQIVPATTSSLIVKVVAGLTSDQHAEIVARNGGTLTSSIPALRLLVVAVAPAELGATLARYQADPQVQSVEQNKVRVSESVPSDPLYVNQWALPKIGWDQVFGVITPTGSAKVALLDTGLDASHPELAGKGVAGTSMLDGSNGMTDPSGHGTWLAGIIAAQTDTIPSDGIAAVAYAGVQIVPVTVLNANGEGQDSDVIAGVLWAADHGADVILMAFSAPDFSPNLQDAIDYAWSKGVVVVAAVGNDTVGTPTFPAGDRGVMGVAATDQNDALASFSNSGQAVFVAAPGVEIQTIDILGNYIVVSGTSTSAAYVAGLAAFMKAVDPTLSNGVIVGRIARNADPAGRQDQTGNGRINMPRALADTSTEFIEPAGAAPVGNGGPFVGPYQAAASLTVTCSLNPVALNSSTTCTAQEGASNGNNINWTVSPSGSGTFSPTSCKMGPPNSNNQCSVIYTATSLGNGSQTITATDTSNGNLQGTAALTVIGPAAKLAFTTNPSVSSTAGGAFSAVVTLQDVNGTTVTGTAQTVTLAIQNNPGGGTLSGTTTVAVNTSSGQATFSGLSIDKAGTGYTLTATGSTVSTTPGTVVSNAFNITAGAVNSVTFVQRPTDTVAGQNITPAVTVRAQDSFGNNVSGASVVISKTSGTGTLSGTLTQTTNSNGVATFANLSINLIGAKVLTATSNAKTTASDSFSITAAAANKVVFVQPPTTATAGQVVQGGRRVGDGFDDGDGWASYFPRSHASAAGFVQQQRLQRWRIDQHGLDDWHGDAQRDHDAIDGAERPRHLQRPEH